MKICFITSSFPRYIGDTSAPWLLKTAKELKKMGVEVSVFAPSYNGIKQKLIDGIPIYRFRYFFKSSEKLTHEESSSARLNELKYKILIICYIFSGCLNSFFYFRKNKFDVITVHWPFPQAIFGIIGKYLTGAKLVYHFYASEMLLIRNRFIKTLFNFFMLFADHIVTISSFTENVIKNELKFKSPVSIIPFSSSLPDNIITEVSYPNENKSKILKLLFVGRLIERKGILYFLEAIKNLTERRIPVSVTIIGEGYQKELVKKFILENGLEKYIILKGEVPIPDLVNEYKECDIFVFPSITDKRGDTEGLGCVIIEALMYKKPVIASNVGGVVDIVKDNVTGFLVPEKDPLELVKKILFIRDNYDFAKQIAENGYNYVIKNFSWDVIVTKLLKVYQR